MVPWSHWRQPFSGWMLTVLTSEFTHFNLVIRLSKVNSLPCGSSAILRCPAASAVPWDPRELHSFMWSHSEQSETSFSVPAASAFDTIHGMSKWRQQACLFPAGVVSLVSGEVKHVVHLIRWNLKAVLCRLGQELTTGLEWHNCTTFRFRDWILSVKPVTQHSS